MKDFFDIIINNINLFDFLIFLIFIYCIVQCFIKGFSLSLISFMKWVLSTSVTIILVPKLQPTVSEYIESEFINNIGLGMIIFILTLFFIILLGKALGKAVTWTGVGSIDKTFGMIFGIFKGYVICVCVFSLLNWFYPHQKWPIETRDTYSFEIIYKGSEFLIKEFPNSKEYYQETEEKIEKI